MEHGKPIRLGFVLFLFIQRCGWWVEGVGRCRVIFRSRSFPLNVQFPKKRAGTGMREKGGGGKGWPAPDNCHLGQLSKSASPREKEGGGGVTPPFAPALLLPLPCFHQREGGKGAPLGGGSSIILTNKQEQITTSSSTTTVEELLLMLALNFLTFL